LIKEKKEKENVLTNLELINLKSISLLKSEEIRGKKKEVKIEKMWKQIRSIKAIYNSCRDNWRIQMKKKSLDLICVKKRLKDYDEMLQHNTVMRTKSKMKDFDVEFEEWWEVAEEYFSKELEKKYSPT
jgi:hypothetical protein